MKYAIPLLLLGFGVTLAVVIGQRMSADAMAVIVGVAVGVAASVPTSLLLVALLRRANRESRPIQPDAYSPYPAQLPPAQPQIMIFDPAQYLRQTGAQYQTPLAPPELGDPALGGMPRLRVLGDDADWGNGHGR